MIKKNLLAFFLIASVFTTVAQETSKCEENFAAFETNVKAAKYDDAMPQLDELVKKCPKINEELYNLGNQLLNYKIEASQTKEGRQLYIDKAMELYIQHEKSFSASKNTNNIKRALLKSDYKLADDDEVFGLLNSAFETKRQDFTDYRALELYYNLYLKRFEEGEKGLTEQAFIKRYGELSSQVVYNKNKISERKAALLTKKETLPLTIEEQEFLNSAQNNLNIFTALGENMDALSSKYISCEKLNAFYTADYDKNQKDAEWLEAMVSAMFNNKCYESAVLEKGAVALFEIKPSADVASQLGNLYLKKNNRDQAVIYLEKAAQMVGSPQEKADIYFKIAGIYRNFDKGRTKEYLLKSIKEDDKSARPYITLAELYSSVTNECNVTPFEQKAILWLSIDTLNRAAQAQPKYKPTVDSMIGSYEKRLPTKEEAKAAGKRKGDEIRYGCWINETVTIPNMK